MQSDRLLTIVATIHSLWLDVAPRRRDDAGEGVISVAIAVLIVAFLGALMWVAFNSIWQEAETNTRDQINQIGS